MMDATGLQFAGCSTTLVVLEKNSGRRSLFFSRLVTHGNYSEYAFLQDNCDSRWRTRPLLFSIRDATAQ